MIGERKAGLAAGPIARSAIDRPACQRGSPDAASAHGRGQSPSRSRPNDYAPALESLGVVWLVRGQRDPRRFVNSRQRDDRAVHGERQPGRPQGSRSPLELCLANRRRRAASRRSRAPPGPRLPCCPRPRHAAETRIAGVRTCTPSAARRNVLLRALRPCMRARVEIAGIDECARGAFDQQLRATQNVAGRKERQAVFAKGPWLVEGVCFERALVCRSGGRRSAH